MYQKSPTRWIAVLFLLFSVITWNACSKDHSFEHNNGSVIGGLFPEDSTGNDPGDSTGTDPGNGGDTAANGGNDDTTTVADVEFMKKATVINRAQITNAKLSKERGSLQAVRDFGTALDTRFLAAQGDLDNLAVTMSVSVPATTDAAHLAITNSLMDMEGKTFDIAFIDYQMAELQRAVDLYRGQIDSGRDAEVKKYAEKYLPYLQEFLITASNIRASL